MDARTAPLNPCSVETIPEPVELADGRWAWPLMLSCYELEQETGQRVGHMDLSLIEMPDIASHISAMPLQFDKAPYTILDTSTSSGILDGKWSAMPSSAALDDSDTTSVNNKSWCFASAHSTGEIRIHAFQVKAANDLPRLESDPLFAVNFLCQSDGPKVDAGACAPLCLSLSWDALSAYKQTKSAARSDLSRIVSTYSNGTMAIHEVALGSGERMQLMKRDSWEAHYMFTSPAEVWSACFAGRDVVLSGGDEGKLKVWDIRATMRPMQVLGEPFEAGVTCLSAHPAQENIVAVGSYDENVYIFDLRYMSRRRPLCTSGKLGGGIWRMKWHPYMPNRMLVGAMHAGCRVLNFSGGCFDVPNPPSASVASVPLYEVDSSLDTEITTTCTKSFSKHESMAYGADWLVCPHPTQNGYFEAAASCSFYDRAVFLWDSVF